LSQIRCLNQNQAQLLKETTAIVSDLIQMILMVRVVAAAGVTLLQLAEVQLLLKAAMAGQAVSEAAASAMAAGVSLWLSVAAMWNASHSVKVDEDYWKQSSLQELYKTDQYEMQMLQ